MMDSVRQVLEDLENVELASEYEEKSIPLCSKCNKLAVSPVMSCNEYICLFCISKDPPSTPTTAPVPLSPPVSVLCPCTGCSRKVPIFQLEKHLGTCRHCPMQCHCGEKMKRMELSRHRRTAHSIQCTVCLTSVPASQIEEHMAQTHHRCQGCQQYINPSDPSHALVDCPVSSCHEQVPQCSLASHAREVTGHVEELLVEVQELRTEVNVLTSEAEKRAVTSGSLTLSLANEEIARLNRHMDDYRIELSNLKQELKDALRQQASSFCAVEPELASSQGPSAAHVTMSPLVSDVEDSDEPPELIDAALPPLPQVQVQVQEYEGSPPAQIFVRDDRVRRRRRVRMRRRRSSPSPDNQVAGNRRRPLLGMRESSSEEEPSPFHMQNRARFPKLNPPHVRRRSQSPPSPVLVHSPARQQQLEFAVSDDDIVIDVDEMPGDDLISPHFEMEPIAIGVREDSRGDSFSGHSF